METRTLDEFLNELYPPARPLIVAVMEREFGCEVLDFFRRRSLTWFEVDDIVYYLRHSVEQVNETLNWLMAANVVKCQSVLNLKFYGLTQDSEMLRVLEQYWTWRDEWHARLQQVQHTLHLNTASSPESTSTVSRRNMKFQSLDDRESIEYPKGFAAAVPVHSPAAVSAQA